MRFLIFSDTSTLVCLLFLFCECLSCTNQDSWLPESNKYYVVNSIISMWTCVGVCQWNSSCVQ